MALKFYSETSSVLNVTNKKCRSMCQIDVNLRFTDAHERLRFQFKMEKKQAWSRKDLKAILRFSLRSSSNAIDSHQALKLLFIRTLFIYIALLESRFHFSTAMNSKLGFALMQFTTAIHLISHLVFTAWKYIWLSPNIARYQVSNQLQMTHSSNLNLKVLLTMHIRSFKKLLWKTALFFFN